MYSSSQSCRNLFWGIWCRNYCCGNIVNLNCGYLGAKRSTFTYRATCVSNCYVVTFLPPRNRIVVRRVEESPKCSVLLIRECRRLRYRYPISYYTHTFCHTNLQNDIQLKEALCQWKWPTALRRYHLVSSIPCGPGLHPQLRFWTWEFTCLWLERWEKPF